ncbi:hypothetical protein [Dichotomicrobium thermohalophilum]|uniref:Uncharacterized protein n=1 Tax=Dichotomicrobium thermohalophilum TaxID=933063 RepID=A0A397Q9N0_9HYPH|nr:hypothetical protein [Dichotomicrobium thermohalophilum]RIA56505.1 hypothetical protein BXY53_1611 [Dichotomicrobium thermohalophilum]
MGMEFSELTQGRIDALTFILSLFSVFFTIVSAYIAALYFFLGIAPLPLRLLAFFVLSVSFLFLGAMSFTVSDIVEVLVMNWENANIPLTSQQAVRSWMAQVGSNFDFYYVGALLGWAVAFIVYLALAYLTFGYRWKQPETVSTTRTLSG